MPRIPSANPDFKEIASLPSAETNYVHPISTQDKRPIPVAFQITSPFNHTTVLLPHTLVMHVNPQNIQENFNQKIERFQTRGGWQEQHWGQELEEISADGSTGAFMNIYTGLSSVMRQRTIAWDRYRDLHDLYKHNGSVYDPYGSIVLQGHVMLLYDRGVYIGGFRTFEMEETDDSPFAFKLSWSFKVEYTISSIHVSPRDFYDHSISRSGLRATTEFQSRNIPSSGSFGTTPLTSEEITRQATAEAAADRRRASLPSTEPPNPDLPTFAELNRANAQADQRVAQERAEQARLQQSIAPFKSPDDFIP